MATTTAKTGRSRKLNLFKPLTQISEIVSLLIKRQRHYLGLSLLALLDIILAVGLVTNASFFSQAVDRVVLVEELNAFSRVTGRPPFSTSVYVFPSRSNPLSLENAELVGQNIAEVLSSEVGLPLLHSGLQVSSGSMMLIAPPDSPLFLEGSGFLGTAEVVYIEDVTPEMELVEGKPFDAGGQSGEVLEVWVHDRMVQKMGLQLGETINLGLTVKDPNQIQVQVAGIWHSRDKTADFWFSDPDATLNDALVLRRADYLHYIQPITAGASGEVSWYVILDETKLIPSESAGYLTGFERAKEIINKFLPGTRLNSPPLDPLTTFVDRSRTMTVLLLAYNLPAFGILLYFLVLTSATIAQWQKREISVLVSRGMNLWGVMRLILVEQSLLFVVGYPLGIAFGMGLAYMMGYTESFLTFTTRDPLPVSLQGLSIQLTLVALAISLFARLYPALKSARSSLVAEERERARPVNKPFWYRFYLDVILLVPTFYAYTQLSQRGSLAGLIESEAEDLYRDPLLILVPALFVVTASLVTMRLFHFVMRAVDFAAGKAPWISVHLALRQLGRQSLDYVTPLLLVIISLALGVYTLSMAASLDQWLVDRMYYKNGADAVIKPLPSDPETPITDGNWIPSPGEFTSVPGIEAAARVGDYPTTFYTTSEKKGLKGSFLAVDRAEFGSTAWFRDDFAGEPLGAMMNRLALTQDAILVSEAALQAAHLNINDTISAAVKIENGPTLNLQFTIVGVYSYFPTIYEEEDGPTVIGNLDYLTSWLGYMPPHNIWTRLAAGAPAEDTLNGIYGRLPISYVTLGDARGDIETEQAKMERVGIFGTLSVGFLATAVMAILSLLIYSYASLQERSYRFAVLHAVGLSRRQIMVQVIMEYAFLAIFGAVAGAVIGIAASELFVPFFRFTGEVNAPLPPLLPLIAGNQLRNLSITFALVIVIAEVATVASTLHNRLAQMLKRAWL